MVDYICDACNNAITGGYVIVLDPKHCGFEPEKNDSKKPILLHSKTGNIIIDAITIGTCYMKYAGGQPTASNPDSVVPFDQLAERIEKFSDCN